MLHEDGLTSSDLGLIQPSPPVWRVPWPLTALGGESLNKVQSGEREKRPGNGRACFHSLAAHVSGQRDISSPAEQCLLVPRISPRCREHCLGCYAQCHPLWLSFSILWTFDPCPSFGYFLPQLLILVSLHFCWNISSLRCAKPLITCLYGHALAETPSKGEEQQRLFSLFAWVLFFFF